ncbi:MAG: late competence development ComFB family protein [Desulfohalobiaceae bacterium]|nr:late competence development ComFB family protein [Desulfohalobiaceae bacterium]
MSNEDKLKEKYRYGSVSLYRIRNKNEQQVIQNLDAVLREFPDFQPNTLDIQDIYALALNKLPPHYKQEASIVLSESTPRETIRQALREAVEKVRANPNYSNEA